MALDIMRRDIAERGDPADFPASLERYSLTDRAPVPVANLTAANQLANQLADNELESAFPFFTWIEAEQRHMCKPSPDDPWVIVGGRLHGAHVRVDRTADPNTLTQLHVVEFLKQSVGFTRASNGGILIPETGLYRVRLGGRVVGILSSTPGRRFFGLELNGQSLGGNEEFEGGTSAKLYDEWPFQKGDVLMATGFQNTGARRVIEATLGVYQSLDPSW